MAPRLPFAFTLSPSTSSLWITCNSLTTIQKFDPWALRALRPLQSQVHFSLDLTSPSPAPLQPPPLKRPLTVVVARRPTPQSTAPPPLAAVVRSISTATMAPIPKTMSGILVEETGGVDVLKYKTDLPVPEPKEGEVLVKIEYIGINYIDTYFRTGLYKAALPYIPGREAAGTVIATHPSVSASADPVKENDKVTFLAGSTYAQYATIAADKVVRLPEGVDTSLGAASLLQGLTALTLIRESGGIGPNLGVSEGPWVLVYAAAGGVGSLMVQILRVLGVKVIGTASTPEKLKLVRSYGAQWVVNSVNEDIVARVKEITNGRGVDVVFDGVGKDTFEGNFEILARKGTLVTFGNASGAVPPVEVFRLAPKNLRLLRPVLNNYIVTREELEKYSNELFGLIQSKKIEVDIHKIYPLKEVGQAHLDLEGRKTTGKLLLTP